MVCAQDWARNAPILVAALRRSSSGTLKDSLSFSVTVTASK